MMASVAKRVIAFEPDPWTLDVLQANVADLDNVKIEGVAAGTHEGRVLLYRHVLFEENPALHSESSSLVASKSNVAQEGAVAVSQIDFIAYLEQLNEDIGVVKLILKVQKSIYSKPCLIGPKLCNAYPISSWKRMNREFQVMSAA